MQLSLQRKEHKVLLVHKVLLDPLVLQVQLARQALRVQLVLPVQLVQMVQTVVMVRMVLQPPLLLARLRPELQAATRQSQILGQAALQFLIFQFHKALLVLTAPMELMVLTVQMAVMEQLQRSASALLQQQLLVRLLQLVTVAHPALLFLTSRFLEAQPVQPVLRVKAFRLVEQRIKYWPKLVALTMTLPGLIHRETMELTDVTVGLNHFCTHG
jgi:hypothetical protein|tara:strand:- start:247 stop:888 length:642 start_codon:yes stop_codon:yes gene_type:complete